MTMAATAPPYGNYIILKGVCSVALLCQWLQPLTSEECLTIGEISQILKKTKELKTFNQFLNKKET